LKSLVIIPTYNEKENIKVVIDKVNALGIDIDILVVDDNSPDGTGKIVSDLAKENSRIHLIGRKGKLGLGSAYVEGFKWALSRDYEYIIEMDADLSHNPFDIPRLLNKSKKSYDVVIGSRYCDGVNVVHWPIKRLILSYGANKYTRIVTGLPVKDCTAGFVCYKRVVLENINFEKIKSTGYAFQIEMKYRAWKKGFSLVEIPIIFEERTEGKSKMTKHIIYEAALMVWKLKILSILGLLK